MSSFEDHLNNSTMNAEKDRPSNYRLGSLSTVLQKTWTKNTIISNLNGTENK